MGTAPSRPDPIRPLHRPPAGLGPDGGETDCLSSTAKMRPVRATASSPWRSAFFLVWRIRPIRFPFTPEDLLVRATLEPRGGALTLRRRASGRALAHDKNGRALTKGSLFLWLHGLDGEWLSARVFFARRRGAWRVAAEEIARAKGDLGQLLYAGSQGFGFSADS